MRIRKEKTSMRNYSKMRSSLLSRCLLVSFSYVFIAIDIETVWRTYNLMPLATRSAGSNIHTVWKKEKLIRLLCPPPSKTRGRNTILNKYLKSATVHKKEMKREGRRRMKKKTKQTNEIIEKNLDFLFFFVCYFGEMGKAGNVFRPFFTCWTRSECWKTTIRVTSPV